jgi:hypothetical protein
MTTRTASLLGGTADRRVSHAGFAVIAAPRLTRAALSAPRPMIEYEERRTLLKG